MFNINNRRYLGSKFKLLNFIDEVISKHCTDCHTFTDLFGGTGVVADNFNNRYDVNINDILLSNVYAYHTFFSQENIRPTYLEDVINQYNQLKASDITDNYYSKNFADTFLSTDNMKKVGFIRDDIDNKYHNNIINEREKAILVTALIYAIDKIANTVGHYDAFRKTGDLRKLLFLQLPNIKQTENENNQIFQMDANQLVKTIKSDIVYIDPPYNSRQYSDAYHFLENLANNQKPEVVGVARKMDRSHIKSAYCTTKAVTQFQQLIEDIQAKFIIVSYNNTGNKINSRSNAKISDQEIIDILSKKGKTTIYEKDFNAFTTGKTNLSKHKERLFVCEVGKLVKKPLNKNSMVNTDEIIKSPLNYTGGKYKLIPQIQSKLPKDIDVFYDVFSGGVNIGANIPSNKTVCIDYNHRLISLLKYLQQTDYLTILEQLEDKISHYGLSNSYQYGYTFYGCDSSKGLGSYNKQAFLKLREDYNNNNEYILFLLLIIFSFNNQIRFNNKGNYNLPVGKRDFNNSLRKKLQQFMQRIQKKKIDFICADFKHFEVDYLVQEQAFLYLDPPYYLGTATYNENGGWTKENELDLLDYLDNCHQSGIRFALSNVMKHKGQIHNILLNWCIQNEYNINYLTHSYNNSNYQIKNKTSTTQEVLITNY